MKGRKPKPVEVARREGNPGKRKLGDPVIIGTRLINAADIPPCPDSLVLTDELDAQGQDESDNEAQILWEETCALLIDGSVIVQGDLITVEMFVASVLEARRAWHELRVEGSVVPVINPRGGRNSTKANPAHRVWLQSMQMVAKFGEQLGLSPQARARLGLTVGKGKKLWDEMDGKLPPNPVSRDSDSDDKSINIIEGEATDGMDGKRKRTQARGKDDRKQAATKKADD